MASKPYTKPTIFRAGVVKGFDTKPELSREGGEFGAGYIKNFAVITVGEALGHGAWVDNEFVEQVAQELAKTKKGVKSRYTHPNQCGDSLSKGLGRVFYRSDGAGKVRGDLHFWKAAHKTPDGDLAGFLLDMAEDDPEAFGASISFMRDPEAEELFAMQNPISPDRENENNYPHVRLGKLRFIDIVDEPAANPDGLFHRGGEVANAESIMEYALGIREDRPSDCDTIFGIESDRLLNFVSTFLNTRGLQVVKINFEGQDEPIVEDQLSEGVVESIEEAPAEETFSEGISAEELEEESKEEVVSEEFGKKAAEEKAPKKEPEAEKPEVVADGASPAAKSPKDKGHFSKEELGVFIENFGKDLGVDYFMKEMDFSEAQSQFISAQKAQIAELKHALELSEQTENLPLSGNNGEGDIQKGKGFKVNFA